MNKKIYFLVLIVSFILLAKTYKNLVDIEETNRGYLDNIDKSDIEYNIIKNEKIIGELKTTFENNIIKVSKINIKLNNNLENLSPYTISNAEIILLSNPINQLVSLRIKITSVSGEVMNIITKNINPIELKIVELNKVFTIPGPVYLKDGDKNTFRIKLPEYESYKSFENEVIKIFDDYRLETKYDNNK